jgi:hypothetical protein
MSILTEQDVRNEAADRFPAQHSLHSDILFSSADIADAMRSAARQYNSIQPLVDSVDPSRLPGDSNIFLDGVVAALYRRLRNSEALNELSYSAGNVNVVGGTLKQNMEKLAKEYEERFVSAATQRKVSINISRAFGRIG